MQKVLVIIILLITNNLFSQGIIGKWKNIDDNNQAKSIIEIYQENGIYYGKILQVVQRKDGICTTCVGKYHTKNINGLLILKDLKKNGEKYENGTIIDPENAKKYSCYLQLENNSKLKIRGFIGLSIIGRTEYWYRVTKEELITLENN